MEKTLLFQAEPALKRSSVTNLLFKAPSKLFSDRRKSSINQKTDRKPQEKSTEPEKAKPKLKETPRVAHSTQVLTSKENQMQTPSASSKTGGASNNNTFFYLKNGLKRQHSNNPQKFESMNQTLIVNKETKKKTAQKSFHFDSKRDIHQKSFQFDTRLDSKKDVSQKSFQFDSRIDSKRESSQKSFQEVKREHNQELNCSIQSSSNQQQKHFSHNNINFSLHVKQRFILPTSPVLQSERKQEDKEVSAFEATKFSIACSSKDIKNQSFSKFLEENHFKKPQKKGSHEFKRRLFQNSKDKNINIKTISLVQKEEEPRRTEKTKEKASKRSKQQPGKVESERTKRKKFRFFNDFRKFTRRTKKIKETTVNCVDSNKDLEEQNAQLMSNFEQELKLYNAIKKENLILKSLFEINKIFNVKLDLSSFDCFRNYPEIVVSRSEFQVLYDKLLGKGGFAEVYAGIYQKKAVAVKIITISNEHMKHLLNEIMTMMLCVHGNLVRLLALSIEEGKNNANEVVVYLLMELMRKDLKQIVFTEKRKLAKSSKYAILVDVLKGLSYLHDSNYVHCDLKLQNILLDDSHRAKISDFGLAKSLRSGNTKKSLIYGYSERCSSYEYLVEERISTKGDVWSFGILAYELLKEKVSWDRLTGVQAVAKVSMKTPFFSLNERLDDGFENQLIEMCLNYNYAMRPSAKELLDLLEERRKFMGFA